KNRSIFPDGKSLRQADFLECPCEAPFNFSEVWDTSRDMLSQLRFPAFTILFDACCVARGECMRINTSMLSLRPENRCGCGSVDLCFLKQQEQIVKIAA